jgi:glycosyltransferase involved in cell wall biosynthesis
MNDATVRVCHVITRLDLGGAQANTLYTVSHLRAPFHASLVSGPGGLLDDDARRLPAVSLTFAPSLVRPIRPHLDLAACRELHEIFRRERPSIVHTHSSKAGILGRVAARLAGVPVIIHTVHGFGFHDEQPWPARAFLVALERAVAPLTTRFIAVSRANIERGIRLGIFQRHRVALIRSGIRIAEFESAGRDPALAHGDVLRRELGLAGRGPIVGMVACLKPQKSPVAFVEVAARVAAAVPEAVFVIVGDGDLRPSVQARAEALGLRDRLHLLGWRRDVPRIMASLDVLVLTSLWEGLPRVIPEAIAAGVPVVATGVDGTADILEDGVTGFVRPPRDLEGLASSVTRLLLEPGLGKAVAARARKGLREFDIDVMVRAQEALYLELLGEAGLPGRAPSAGAYIDDATAGVARRQMGR